LLARRHAASIGERGRSPFNRSCLIKAAGSEDFAGHGCQWWAAKIPFPAARPRGRRLLISRRPPMRRTRFFFFFFFCQDPKHFDLDLAFVM
jgi:hypothetical protein